MRQIVFGIVGGKLILAALRRLVQSDQPPPQSDWSPQYPYPRQLIIGFYPIPVFLDFIFILFFALIVGIGRDLVIFMFLFQSSSLALSLQSLFFEIFSRSLGGRLLRLLQLRIGFLCMWCN